MTREQVYQLIEEHYREHFDIITRRISRYLGSRYNAEDVLQEAYYRTCKYWDTYDDKQDFKKWFNVILNNSIKDFFKKQILHGMSVDVLPEIAAVQTLQRIEIGELVKLIEEQEERVCRILKLYLLEGYTSYEVAEIVPESAVNIRKIVERFRNGLSK